MGTEDVRRAAQAMDDDALRERVAAGDFSDLSDLTLDEHERAVLTEAATRYRR